MLGCGIWEIILVLHMRNACSSQHILVYEYILIVCTFLRVYYLIFILLYPCFYLCCFCVPDTFVCKRWLWLSEASLDPEIWEQLENGEWGYEELAMSHTI